MHCGVPEGVVTGGGVYLISSEYTITSDIDVNEQ